MSPRPVAEGLPAWVSWVDADNKPLLTDAQIGSLNPSLAWAKVVASGRLGLSGAAVTVAMMLYLCSTATGAPFWVGERLLATMANRTRAHLRKGLDHLIAAGLLIATRRDGARTQYQLALPTEPPTGCVFSPRRTTGVENGPRRTEQANGGTGVENGPVWNENAPTTGAENDPRRTREHLLEPSATGREGGGGEPSRQTLVAFAKTVLPPLDDPDAFEAWAQADVDGNPEAWRGRYRLANMEPSDAFYAHVAPKLPSALRAKLDAEWNGLKRSRVAKILANSGLSPSAAATIVLDADLSGAKSVVGLMLHKLSEAAEDNPDEHRRVLAQFEAKARAHKPEEVASK